MTNRTLVVVPTRNRARLARAAITSARIQGSAVQIQVSDNSTEVAQAVDLHAFCTELHSAGIAYVRPPQPMAMTAHWEWALRHGLEQSGFTHVLYLTDRMVFTDGALANILRLADCHPARVISYNHDRIDDSRPAVTLEQRDWSGKLFEIPSEQLLRLTARAIIPPCLPRLLNSIVPVEVLATVRHRFGTVFSSFAPDYALAYRLLTMLDSILYYDGPAMIHYALDRSNGATYSRGIASTDNLDFMANLGGAVHNGAAPVPAFHTATNPIFHEYAAAKAAAGSDRFPAIDWFQYLGMMDWDSREIVNPALTASTAALLRANGWRRRDRVGWLLPRLLGYVRADPLGALAGLMRRAPSFPTTEAAIDYANRHPRPARPRARHFYIWFMMQARDAMREIPLSG